MKQTTLLLIAFTLTFLNSEKTMAQQSTTNSGEQIEGDVFTILVLYQATNHWLSLTREERNRFTEQNLYPVLQKFDGRLSVRFFDSEAFHAHVSDFLIIETQRLKDYYFFMEYLRDTALFSKPYIVLKDVIMGIEGGFEEFENTELKRN